MHTNKTFKNALQVLIWGYRNKLKHDKDYFCTTYDSAACNNMQCHEARRSFEDLLEICRTYLPNTTEVEVADAIYAMHKRYEVRPYFCHGVNKCVYRCYPEDKYTTYFSNIRDAETLRNNSPYSAMDVYNLMTLKP